MKILHKVLGGLLFFDSHCMYIININVQLLKSKTFSEQSCQRDLILVTWFVYVVCIQDVVQLGHYKIGAWWSVQSVTRPDICLEWSDRERLHSARQTVSRFQHQHNWACLLIVSLTHVYAVSQLLSYDVCLDVRGRLSELFCVVLCTEVVHSHKHT